MAKKSRSGTKRRTERRPAKRATPAPAATPAAVPVPASASVPAPVPASASVPAPAPVPVPASTAATAPRAPAFWFDFSISWPKLALGRVILFSLLAVDALLQLRHAPRYGAGSFNVSQLPLPFLDALGPTRSVFAVAELVNAYLFTLAACGVATRVAVPIAATIYSWLYFGSQLDSYQHHYLVALLLILACFVPWQRPADASPRARVRSWALRLMLVQLAIMYLWAAISKMNAAWLDGRTLAGQISGPIRTLVDATVHTRGAAVLVLATELVLAATVWLPRAWPVAATLGLGLHVGILLSELEIGLFAWLMIGIYVFIVPDRIWIALAELPPLRALARAHAAASRALAGNARWLACALAIAGAFALASISRFDDARTVESVLTVAVIGAATVAALAKRLRMSIGGLAVAHVLAFGVWTVVDRASTIAVDYYRFWGGNARRLGDREGAERAYRGMVELVPDDSNGHFHLGQLLIARGADDEGLIELHAAEHLEPHRARAFLVEARWLASKGRRADALAKAREALAADPSDGDARAVIDALTSGASAAPAREAP